ncbi:MAG: Isochorismatase [Parcubacteria group bacterium]|nr:Isochorismatase [Parcubacteria group bacterium]
MDIRLPNPDRKRALVLVDMQADFIGEDSMHIIPRIQGVIREGDYDLIVNATFHTEVGSLWDRQDGFLFPKEPTIPEIAEMLGPNTIRIEKTTKSVFKGDIDLARVLREKGIEEVHFVGLDTNDCVLSSAEESFDLGFYTYVLEECTASSEGKDYHEKALAILREVEMTNHSSRISSHKTLEV